MSIRKNLILGVEKPYLYLSPASLELSESQRINISSSGLPLGRIYNAGNTVLKHWDIEIYQQSKFFFHQAEISQ